MRLFRPQSTGEKCKPNFEIIVTSEPESLLKKMAKQLVTFDNLIGPQVDKFVAIPRPIRVWRNIGLTSIDGANHFQAHGEKYYNDEAPSNRLPSQYGSRLLVSTVTRDIESVIVVVDVRKVREFNFGQLGDYIGLIGFAQVDLDKDLGDAPTMLNLFRASPDARPGKN